MKRLEIADGYIDKVSIIGDMRRRKGDPHLLNFLGNRLDPRIVNIYIIDKYQYDRAVKIKTRNSSALIQVSTRKIDVSDFRIEFNPAKCDEEDIKFILHLLSMVEDKRYTRIDLCLNFYKDLIGYQFIDGRMRSERIYKGASGRLETLYRGSERSDDFRKLYDKKRQQKNAKFKDIDYDWWRLEETIQGKKAENYTEWEWFKGAKLVNGNSIFPEDIDEKDELVIEGCLSKPEKIDKLKPTYKKKIKKLMKELRYGDEFNVGEEIKKTSIVSQTLEVLQQLLSD